MEEENLKRELYRRMRLAKNEKHGSYFPVELLMEWDRVRLKLNPQAVKTDLSKYLLEGELL